MMQQEPPKIEFPCPDYPVKIMGHSGEAFRQFCFEVVQIHAPEFNPASAQIKGSSKGTFESITVFITATGEQQLRALHQQLIASDLVKIVL